MGCQEQVFYRIFQVRVEGKIGEGVFHTQGTVIPEGKEKSEQISLEGNDKLMYHPNYRVKLGKGHLSGGVLLQDPEWLDHCTLFLVPFG